jgi:G3E family GTPase
MSAVPFFLVTGFLGSGKTTLLKRFLNSFADDKKIAVIQNEFAPANIDGKELKETGKPFHILEINKGSVFCVCLLSDFTKSLNELLKTIKPDAVILEATGLADPIAVGELLQANELKDKIYLSHAWCIVDVVNFPKVIKSVQRVSHQIRVADTVILNKMDKFSGDVNELENHIKSLNPFAKISQTSFCDINLNESFAEFTADPVVQKRANELSQFEPSVRPNLGSAVIRSNKKISHQNLELFLKEYEQKAFRLKGFVNLEDGKTVALQSSFGETQILEQTNYVGPTEIIAIGPGIVAGNFSKTFREMIS